MAVIRNFRAAHLAIAVVAALALGACASNPTDQNQVGTAGAAAPGSAQDFVVNVGDRVFFETDSTELTVQARSTLDKQAQWLQNYNRYSFTVEGHADERGTREYNVALGARRSQVVREYLAARGVDALAHAHDLLRQGATCRGLQRHLLLVAEPARRDGAQRKLVSRVPEAKQAGAARRRLFAVRRRNPRQSQFGRSNP